MLNGEATHLIYIRIRIVLERMQQLDVFYFTINLKLSLLKTGGNRIFSNLLDSYSHQNYDSDDYLSFSFQKLNIGVRFRRRFLASGIYNEKSGYNI